LRGGRGQRSKKQLFLFLKNEETPEIDQFDKPTGFNFQLQCVLDEEGVVGGL
jgi:hypothetical protein